MAVRLHKTFCCCLSLKTGALLTGWFILVSTVVAVIVTSIMGITEIKKPAEYDSQLTTKTFIALGLAMEYIVAVVIIVVTIGLLYGACAQKRRFLTPYLFFFTLIVICLLGAAIYLIIDKYTENNKEHLSFLIPYFIICAVVLAYSVAVVWSYYWELRDGKIEGGIVVYNDLQREADKEGLAGDTRPNTSNTQCSNTDILTTPPFSE